MCSHECIYTGSSRYDHAEKVLTLVLLCEECRKEVKVVHTLSYIPVFNPHGNDRYLR